MNITMPLRLPATSALIAFETAARLGSLSHAAKELGTSQPAISRTMTQLEKQLSARLFERSRNGVTLTDAVNTSMTPSSPLWPSSALPPMRWPPAPQANRW